MAGKTNLAKLLKGLNPHLNEGEFVFVSVKTNEADQVKRSDVLSEFKESEGTTLIIKRSVADRHRLRYERVYVWITLNVYSSLEAVGLTAVVATKLAEHNVSCNMVAGYYHDHIFVLVRDARQAMRVLRSLARNADLP